LFEQTVKTKEKRPEHGKHTMKIKDREPSRVLQKAPKTYTAGLKNGRMEGAGTTNQTDGRENPGRNGKGGGEEKKRGAKTGQRKLMKNQSCPYNHSPGAGMRNKRGQWVGTYKKRGRQ